MSEVLENLKNRRSCRSYKDVPVPEELISQIVEAGTYAPTGMGRQSPIIIAITNKAIRDQLSRLNAAVMNGKNDPFYGAPVVLVVLADQTIPTYLYDGSTVMENLMLAATDLGLGSCWIHRAKEEFATEEGRALLKQWGIDERYVGIGNCILCYPEEIPAAKPRKEDYVIWVK